MPEGVVNPVDGTAVDLQAAEQEFNRAMAAPPSDAPGLPERPVKDPNEAKQDAKRGRGRPPKGVRATDAKTTTPAKADYTEDVAGLVTGLWVATASIPYTTAYAAIISANKDGLTAAVAAGAKQNTTMRAYVEKFSGSGGGMWAVQLAVVGTNMAMQGMQLMKDPELRKQCAEQTRAEMKAFLTANGVTKLPDAEPESGPQNAAA
jgi:hypothetical protein